MSQFYHNLEKNFNPPGSKSAYLQALAKRLPGSGLWVFNHPSFASWQVSRNSILWMHGPRKLNFKVTLKVVLMGTKSGMWKDGVEVWLSNSPRKSPS